MTWSSGRRLALADGTAVIFADLDQAQSFHPGTIVTARGFVSTGPFGPMLQHVSVMPIGTAAVPPPTNVPGTELLSPEHQGELVSVLGRVIERVSGLGERQTLVLQVGNDVVRAQLNDRLPLSSLPAVQSVVRVTGVCRLQGTTSALEPGGMSAELLLRGVDDIQIVKQAPFWTRMRCSRSRSWASWWLRCWAGRSRCGGDSAASTASSASTSSARRSWRHGSAS